MLFSKVSPEPDIFILYYIIVSILSPCVIQKAERDKELILWPVAFKPLFDMTILKDRH